MNIVWSKKANYCFHNIRNYLEQFSNPLIAQKFIKEVMHVILLLEQNPLLGKYRKDLECREIVISKKVSMYYEINENDINLIAFRNNRQRPLNIIDL